MTSISERYAPSGALLRSSPAHLRRSDISMRLCAHPDRFAATKRSCFSAVNRIALAKSFDFYLMHVVHVGQALASRVWTSGQAYMQGAREGTGQARLPLIGAGSMRTIRRMRWVRVMLCWMQGRHSYTRFDPFGGYVCAACGAWRGWEAQDLEADTRPLEDEIPF